MVEHCLRYCKEIMCCFVGTLMLKTLYGAASVVMEGGNEFRTFLRNVINGTEYWGSYTSISGWGESS